MHHVLNIVLVILFLGLVVGHHGFEHRDGDSVCWTCCWHGFVQFLFTSCFERRVW